MTAADHELVKNDLLPYLMWGSDFPHFGSCWPHTQSVARQVLRGIPEARARRILGFEFAPAYDLDVSHYEALVQRIGSVPSELLLAV